MVDKLKLEQISSVFRFFSKLWILLRVSLWTVSFSHRILAPQMFCISSIIQIHCRLIYYLKMKNYYLKFLPLEYKLALLFIWIICSIVAEIYWAPFFPSAYMCWLHYSEFSRDTELYVTDWWFWELSSLNYETSWHAENTQRQRWNWAELFVRGI